MSLAFEDAMTAIDLCVDAVFLGCGRPLGATGRFCDLGDLKKQHRQLKAPAAIRSWIDHVLPNPDLKLLEECRQPLTQRFVRRHISVAVGEGGPSGKALSEITTLHGQGSHKSWGSIGDPIPRLVGFGEAQLESLCQAILTDFPAPP